MGTSIGIVRSPVMAWCWQSLSSSSPESSTSTSRCIARGIYLSIMRKGGTPNELCTSSRIIVHRESPNTVLASVLVLSIFYRLAPGRHREIQASPATCVALSGLAAAREIAVNSLI